MTHQQLVKRRQMKKKNDYFNLYCRVRASEKCSSIVMHCRSYGAVLLRYGTRDNAKGNKTVGKRQTKKLKLYTFLTRSDSFRPFYLHLKFFLGENGREQCVEVNLY